MAFNWDHVKSVFYIGLWVTGYVVLWFILIKPYILEVVIIDKFFSRLAQKHNKAKMIIQLLLGMVYWTALLPFGALLIYWYGLWNNAYVQSGAMFAAFWVVMGLLSQAHYGLKAIASLDLFLLDAYEPGEHIKIIKPFGHYLSGRVNKIHFRGTVLDTDSQDKATIPNDIMLECEIINHDANKWRYEIMKFPLDLAMVNEQYSFNLDDRFVTEKMDPLTYWGQQIIELITGIKSKYMMHDENFTKIERSWFRPADENAWNRAIHPEVIFDTDGLIDYLIVKVPVNSYRDGVDFRSEFLRALSGYRDQAGHSFPRAGVKSPVPNKIQSEVVA